MSEGLEAFARPSVCSPDGTTFYEGSPGMTMREWYAGMALQGILANPQTAPEPDKVVAAAFEVADAMLAEAAKTR